MPLEAITSLSTPRLLRPVAREDLPDLLEVNGDPEVTRFLPYATWQSLADGAAWLERMLAIGASGAGQQLVAVNAADARVAGTVLLFNVDPGSARIEAQVNPDNLASNALLRKLGFTLEGRLRQRWVDKGVACDTNFYGALADEWLAARGAPMRAGPRGRRSP